jgi:hypothetical protein
VQRGRKNGPRKRRTRGHVIADLAVNHVERHVLRCGHTMQRIIHDYGLDVAIRTYDRRGEVENGLLWIQVKATDHPRHLASQDALAVRVECKDLVFWLGERYPVLLVLYVAQKDAAYWLHIQAELGSAGRMFGLPRSGSTLTLHIPRANVFNEKVVKQFRRLKVQAI